MSESFFILRNKLSDCMRERESVICFALRPVLLMKVNPGQPLTQLLHLQFVCQLLLLLLLPCGQCLHLLLQLLLPLLLLLQLLLMLLLFLALVQVGLVANCLEEGSHEGRGVRGQEHVQLIQQRPSQLLLWFVLLDHSHDVVGQFFRVCFTSASDQEKREEGSRGWREERSKLEISSCTAYGCSRRRCCANITSSSQRLRTKS